MKRPTPSQCMITPGNITQLDNTSYLIQKSFSMEEYPFLRDHIVNGECLFPGAMMLELMAECGDMLFPVKKGSITIENFNILRPIRLPDTRILKLYVTKEADGLKMSLRADYLKGGQTIRKDIHYAESFLRNGSLSTNIEQSIFHDDKLRCFSLTNEDIYCKNFMQSGPFFQGLGKELCFSETHFKGIISPTRSDCNYLVEPVIIDNCFQLANIGTGVINGSAGLPVGIDCLNFLNRPSSQAVYCYGMVERYEDQAVVHNCIVCDENNTIVLTATGVKQHYTGKFNFNVMKHIEQAHDRAKDRP